MVNWFCNLMKIFMTQTMISFFCLQLWHWPSILLEKVYWSHYTMLQDTLLLREMVLPDPLLWILDQVLSLKAVLQLLTYLYYLHSTPMLVYMVHSLCHLWTLVSNNFQLCKIKKSHSMLNWSTMMVPMASNIIYSSMAWISSHPDECILSYSRCKYKCLIESKVR